jgi:hypothetical protein
MTGMPDVETLLKTISEVEQMLVTALPNATDPELRQHLEPLIADWRNHATQMAEVYPQTIKDIEARRQRLIADADAMQRVVDDWHARIDAMEAAAAAQVEAVAKVPAAPVAPSSQPVPVFPAPTPASDGSVWRDDLSTWDTGTQATGAPPPPTPAPQRPSHWNPDESVRDLGED